MGDLDQLGIVDGRVSRCGMGSVVRREHPALLLDVTHNICRLLIVLDHFFAPIHPNILLHLLLRDHMFFSGLLLPLGGHKHGHLTRQLGGLIVLIILLHIVVTILLGLILAFLHHRSHPCLVPM